MNAPARSFAAKPALRPRHAPKPLPPQDKLRRILEFDPTTGDLIWRRRPEKSNSWNGKCAGQIAGSVASTGRFQIGIDGVNYLTHRVVWKWLHNTEPPVVEHRDGNGFNNRPDNLRAACQGENICNRPRRKTKALPKGVFRYRGTRFFARIVKDGHSTTLGSFDTIDEAHEAYCAAARILHREFARFSIEVFL